MGQLSVGMLDTLNSLYRHELTNHLIYRQFQAWAAFRGLSGTEKWFAGQAEGESVHAGKVFAYILDRNETAEPSPFNFTAAFNPASYPALFTSALEVERGTTAAWSAAYAQALAEGDFLTAQWIMDAGGIMAEQLEEENTAQTNVDRLNILCGGGEITGEMVHHFDVLLSTGFPK
jgi:ferritin